MSVAPWLADAHPASRPDIHHSAAAEMQVWAGSGREVSDSTTCIATSTATTQAKENTVTLKRFFIDDTATS